MDLLSPQAIRKQVISKSIQVPIVLYSGVIAVVGTVYSVLFDGSVLSWGISLAAGTVCFAKIFWGYQVKYQHHALEIVDHYHRSLLVKREQALADLQQALNEIKQADALKQLEQLSRKFAAFQHVLDSKLNKDELAYSRYLTMAEAVFVGALDNLRSVVVSAKALSGIDYAHINQQIQSLKAEQVMSAKSSPLIEQQMDALQKRVEIYQQSQQHISTVLTENEQAMTELDRVTTQLSLISSQQGMELETAMEELRLLAQRAQKYSTR